MRLAFVVAALLAASVCTAGEISIYKDKSGPVTITNVPLPDRRDQKATAVIEYEELTDRERRQIEEEKKAEAKAWRERQAMEERELKARMEAERKAEEAKAGAAEIQRLKKDVAEARAAAKVAADRAAALEDAAMVGVYRKIHGTQHKKRPRYRQTQNQSKKNKAAAVRRQRVPGPAAPGNSARNHGRGK